MKLNTALALTLPATDALGATGPHNAASTEPTALAELADPQLQHALATTLLNGDAIAALDAGLPYDNYLAGSSYDFSAWTRLRENHARHALQFRARRSRQGDRGPRSLRHHAHAQHVSPTPLTTVASVSGGRSDAPPGDVSARAGWSSLVHEKRVHRVLRAQLMRAEGLTEPQAQERWRRARRPLASTLADGMQLEHAQRSGAHLVHVQRLLKIEIQLDRLMSTDRAMSYDTALWLAKGAWEDDPPPVALGELYLYALQQSVSAWVDQPKAVGRRLSASAALAAVLHHHQARLPASFYRDFEVKQAYHCRWLDEALLLHDLSHRGDMLAAIRPGYDERFRRDFMNALALEVKKQAVLNGMFAPPAHGATKGDVYFDGFAFRNAFNMTFDDLSSWQVRHPVDGQPEPSFTLETWLDDKFAAMGESAQYPVGSAQHSLGTTLIRLSEYAGQRVPRRVSNDTALLEQFAAVEAGWSNHGSYPIRPRLLFGLHLMRSRGVEMTGPGWRERAWANPDLSTFVDALNQYPPPSRASSGQLSAKDASEDATLLFDQLKTSFKDIAVGSAWNNASAAVRAVADHYTVLLAGHEVIEAEGWREKAYAVIAYATDALLVLAGARPAFDASGAATEILRRYNVSDAQLERQRRYVVATARPAGLVPYHVPDAERTGTLVRELVDKANGMFWTHSMTLPDGQQIDAHALLKPAVQAYNTALPEHRWVRATARETLRMQRAPLTQDAIDKEVRRVAAGCEVLLKDAKIDWEKLLSFVPVLGASYTIEEAVRHHDLRRLVFGEISLSVDAMSFGLGGEFAEPIEQSLRSPAKLALAEGITATSTRTAIHDLEIPLDSLIDDVDALSLNHDPFGLTLPDAWLSDEHRALAARVRAGEGGVSWNGYPVVLLQNEDRVVPVEPQGGSYNEIDWVTGKRRPGRWLVDRQRDTGMYYARLTGLKGGKWGSEDSLVDGIRVSERMTVTATEPLLRAATDAVPRPFATAFERYFSVRVVGERRALDFQMFHYKLYVESPTFRRLFNHAADQQMPASATGRWSIVIGEQRNAKTNFDLGTIDLPSDSLLAAQRYVGPSAHMQQATPEQGYTHEMVHALTGARDPERGARLRNRGPVVYLTDRILSEAGYEFPQQVKYARPYMSFLHDLAAHEHPMYGWEKAAEAMEDENRYLDAIADMHGAAPHASRTLGEPLRQRVTVRELAPLLERAAAARPLPEYCFDERYAVNFRESVQRPAATVGHIPGVFDDIEGFYTLLYEKSKLFRHLFDVHFNTRALEEMDPRWSFVVGERPDGSGLWPTGGDDPVDRVAMTAYLPDVPRHYLSNHGLAELEAPRELTELMVRILSGHGGVAPADALENRGAVVWLADTILRETGYTYPKRIAYASIRSSDEALKQRMALSETPVRRAAHAEDQYLQTIYQARIPQIAPTLLHCLGCPTRS
jgi:hypothetical protein